MSIHSGTTAADLALPAGIPLAVLTPSIVDILKARAADDGLFAKRYRLSLPGMSALDPSKTLAESGIRDGAILLLSQSTTPPPAPRHHDVAEEVSATLEAAEQLRSHTRGPAARLAGALAAGCLTGVGGLALIRNALSANGGRDFRTTVSVAAFAGFIALLSAAIAHRTYQDAVAGLALNAIATAFAAVAGFLAVPGAPGICNVLLAATAAAVTSVLAIRASGCGVVALTAMSCVALVVAVAALVGVVTTAPLPAIGAVSALISLGLVGIAARVSILMAGLSPRLPPDADDSRTGRAGLSARAIRADDWLSSLLAGFSSSAAVGAVVTVLAGAPRLSCMAFGSITGVLLLLRSRSSDSTRMLAYIVSGIGIVGTTFGVAALRMPGHEPWIAAATATLVAAAMYLGFAAPAIPLPPLVRRCAESLEWLALAAMVPLTLWICGIYGAVRGMNLQ